MVMLTGCSTGNNSTTITNATDTVLLYKKDTALVAGINVTQTILHLPEEKKLEVTKKGRLLLVLDHPTVISAPEGVYEIYLTNLLNDIDKLTSSQQSFVSLLDLYSITAPGAKQQVEIDITQHVKNLQSTGGSATPLFAVLKFAPVKLADGTFSSNAGEIHFSGISVVQVNN